MTSRLLHPDLVLPGRYTHFWWSYGERAIWTKVCVSTSNLWTFECAMTGGQYNLIQTWPLTLPELRRSLINANEVDLYRYTVHFLLQLGPKISLNL